MMPLTYTAAYSSRITKPKTKNPFKTSTSSPLSSIQRKTTKSRRSMDTDDQYIDTATHLADHGIIQSLATDQSPVSIAQLIIYIQNQMFEDIPDRGGMNSTRISEVLNYRKNLPPIATSAHIHALSHAPTVTEREIAQAVQQNIVRRISIPGRAAGSTAVGDCIILVDQWSKLIESHKDLGEALIQKYVRILNSHQSTTGVPGGQFQPDETVALIRSGFLTSASHSSINSSALWRVHSPSQGNLRSLSTVGSRAASGSIAAVGGNNAIHEAGGGGGALNGTDKAEVFFGTEYTLSVPSIGLYMKLLEAGRAHVVSLLSKTNYKEAPRYLIRERWDGGVIGEEKSLRKGSFTGVLPGRTKKWKHFYGMGFDWILAECLGSGLLEVFDTGSVGHGLRLT